MQRKFQGLYGYLQTQLYPNEILQETQLNLTKFKRNEESKWQRKIEREPGDEEFLCQKLSHQSDSVGLGSMGVTPMLLDLVLCFFFNFFETFLLFFDLLGGAIYHNRKPSSVMLIPKVYNNVVGKEQ